jgi:hypothetical protein
MRWLIAGVLALITISADVSLAGTVTFSSTTIGNWNEGGDQNRSTWNSWTGHRYESGPHEVNGFFVFDLGPLTGTVTSAKLKLKLDLYYSGDPSESCTLYDVTTPIGELTASGSGRTDIFSDLQGGNAYGNMTATLADQGTLILISLSAAAISDINAAKGSQFAVGAHLTTWSGISQYEGLRWGYYGIPVVTHYLEVVATDSMPGDANRDGTVNGADLNTVLSNYNQPGMDWGHGDFDNNGTVNGADLNIVLSNYNQHQSVGAAVPEPGAMILLLAGAIGLLAYAWPRRRT